MKRLLAVGASLAAQWWSLPVLAQQGTGALTLASEPVVLPAAGRVILVFIVVAGLAVGAAAVLRRYGSKLAPGALFADTGSLRVLERLALSGELNVHLVQTRHGKVLITAHRHSIAVLRLDAGADTGAEA